MTETTATSDISGSTRIGRITPVPSGGEAVVLSNQPGNVYAIVAFAPAAAAAQVYLKLFDKATAPVPGTDIPVFVLPLVSTTSIAGFVTFAIDEGIPFKNGISYAVVGGTGLDTDTLASVTIAPANSLHGTIFYK